MFGFLGTLAYGIAYAFGWASDEKAEQKQRRDSANKNCDFYFDKNGRMRHTASGRKYSPQEVHEAFFSNQGRRDRLRMEYNQWAKRLADQEVLDPEWYTFEDYIVSTYKNNPVTGRELFPEIDWEHLNPNKPFLNPNFKFWTVRDADSPFVSRVFDTKKQAIDYYTNVLAVKRNFIVDERRLRDEIRQESGYTIFYTKRTGNKPRFNFKYIIDKTGEEVIA